MTILNASIEWQYEYVITAEDARTFPWRAARYLSGAGLSGRILGAAVGVLIVVTALSAAEGTLDVAALTGGAAVAFIILVLTPLMTARMLRKRTMFLGATFRSAWSDSSVALQNAYATSEIEFSKLRRATAKGGLAYLWVSRSHAFAVPEAVCPPDRMARINEVAAAKR